MRFERQAVRGWTRGCHHPGREHPKVLERASKHEDIAILDLAREGQQQKVSTFHARRRRL